MKIGMLWFDNSNEPLQERLKRASAYYQDKYGSPANVCFIPSSEKIPEGKVDGVEIRSSGQVLKFHLWLGRAEA